MASKRSSGIEQHRLKKTFHNIARLKTSLDRNFSLQNNLEIHGLKV